MDRNVTAQTLPAAGAGLSTPGTFNARTRAPQAKRAQPIDARDRHAGPHILFYGQFGVGNTGNDATLEAALVGLRHRLPEARFTIIAGAPEVVEAEFQVPAAAITPHSAGSRWPKRLAQLVDEFNRRSAALALLRTADCFIVPGTGIFDDLGVTPMQHAFPMWRWCSLAKRAGVPVIFLSVGAGPVERELSRKLFSWTAKLATQRSFRDETSRTFMHDALGVDTSLDEVTPDLVFGLELKSPPVAAEPVRTVGVGVMGYHTWRGEQGSEDDAYEPYMSKLAYFCGELLESGKAISILLGDAGDTPAAEDLKTRLLANSPGAEVKIATAHSLRDLCLEVAKTDVVLATRYHTIVGALMLGRPAISLGYAVKNRNVMADFGLGEFCQDIWDFDLAVLRGHFAAISASDPERGAKLRAVGEQLRQGVCGHLDRIAVDIRTRRSKSAVR